MPDSPRWRRMFESVEAGHHIGLFYSDLRTAVKAAREYALAGLEAGDFVCLVGPAEEAETWCPLTTEVDERIRRGELPDRFGAVFFPRTEIASEDGRLRIRAFLDKVSRLAALRDSRNLRVFGHLASPLWVGGEEEMPVAAESAVNESGDSSFLCLYDISRVRSSEAGVLRELMRLHDRTITQKGPNRLVVDLVP
ncbi:MAG TPA: MEDS domain-containing protein [Thermoplasmata archaeon]|nr:MEDS domain-containing protein [Thermoplasmata archaeon]